MGRATGYRQRRPVRVGRARMTKNMGERKVAPEQSLLMRGRLTSETPVSAPEPVTVKNERDAQKLIGSYGGIQGVGTC